MALKAAQTALLEKSGVGPALRSFKADLIGKLRSSKQGLPEALAEQAKTVAEAEKVVGGLSGDEFVKQLAAGDPRLAELGISPDEAKTIQQIAGTPEGKNVAEQLRQNSLKALHDAPIEAGKKVDKFLKDLDSSIQKLEGAKDEAQVKSAVDEAASQLGPEEQARQAAVDEQAYLKSRIGSARRAAIREQTKADLAKLQGEMAKTSQRIAELDRELSDARIKLNRAKKAALDTASGTPERAKAVSAVKAAQQELDELAEADELGGAREERQRQRQAEEALFESLELKRPTLWEATKEKIRQAAKRDGHGNYLDANTGEVIKGEPVYGHKYGRENRRLILEASEKGMTQEQFTKWVNDHPDWFQLETKENNESHRFEKPGVD